MLAASRRSLATWAGDAVRGNAREARAFVSEKYTQDTQIPQVLTAQGIMHQPMDVMEAREDAWHALLDREEGNKDINY